MVANSRSIYPSNQALPVNWSDTAASLHYKKYGLAVIDRTTLLDQDRFYAILADSQMQHRSSWECRHDEMSERASPQKNRRAHFGESTYAWLNSERMHHWLHLVTGESLQLSSQSSCFTYYERDRDFLAPHTDHPRECRASFLLYLDVMCVDSDRPGAGLYLMVGQGNDREPRWMLRARPRRIIVLNGSVLPHWRAALQVGERVSMISACFRSAR